MEQPGVQQEIDTFEQTTFKDFTALNIAYKGLTDSVVVQLGNNQDTFQFIREEIEPIHRDKVQLIVRKEF